jgi:hypothetical protein
LARRLFRRHVAGRTENGASDGLCHGVREVVQVVFALSQQFGQAKIEELDRPISRDQDVGRFQIAVQYAAIVSRFQRARDLDRLADGFCRRDRTTEWLAVDVLEHKIARPDVVQLADVRMIQRRNRSRFVFESAEAFRVMGHWRGEHFDGDVAIETRIASAVDFAHPARAE